jgi:hypothetical protein
MFLKHNGTDNIKLYNPSGKMKTGRRYKFSGELGHVDCRIFTTKLLSSSPRM